MSLGLPADYTGDGARGERPDEEGAMPDVTVREIDEMGSIGEGLVRRAVSSITGFAGYPKLFPELGLPLALAPAG